MNDEIMCFSEWMMLFSDWSEHTNWEVYSIGAVKEVDSYLKYLDYLRRLIDSYKNQVDSYKNQVLSDFNLPQDYVEKLKGE